MRCLAIFTALLLIAACSERDSTDTTLPAPPPQQSAESPPPQPVLAGSAWSVADIDGRAAVPEARSNLEFLEDGKVAGRGGCNRYGGPVEISGGAIRFGALISTKMACAGGAMEQEQRFFKALDEVRRYQMTGGELVLIDEAGSQRIRLTKDTGEPTV